MYILTNALHQILAYHSFVYEVNDVVCSQKTSVIEVDGGNAPINEGGGSTSGWMWSVIFLQRRTKGSIVYIDIAINLG